MAEQQEQLQLIRAMRKQLREDRQQVRRLANDLLRYMASGTDPGARASRPGTAVNNPD
jgi:gamma-glutamyl:cysteine ligase YbdK (ATP-grasp superfamily)